MPATCTRPIRAGCSLRPSFEERSLGQWKGTETGPVVVAQDVARRYGEGETAVDALRGVSVDIARSRLTAVMGPSGSGKSTLMHILAGLDKPTSGTVEVAGTEITTLGDNDLTKLRREHIGFVFQFFNLLPMLNARENITLPLTIAGEKPEDGWVEKIVGDVGLSDRLGHRPSELSGGQQQRVAIARALVSKPTVLFADEPTGNLDSSTGSEILELLRRSVDDYGQTMVMVTHDARAAAMAHRVLFLADGADRARARRVRHAPDPRGPGGDRRLVIRFAIRGLLGRKLRAVLTGIAIVLGVAMISGTYILTDTIDKAFSNLFTQSYAGTDAVVQGEGPDIWIDGDAAPTPPVDASLLETVREVDEVALATGGIYDETNTKILTPDGDAVSTGGAPSFGFGIDTSPEYAQFNPLNLLEGRWPSAPNEVVIDAGTADGQSYALGDTVEIATLVPKRAFELVGVAQYGGVDSLGTATFAVFTIPTAQELLDREGQYDAISVAAKEGTSEEDLVARDPGRAPGGRDGADRDRGDGRGAGRDRPVHVDHPLLPVDVRRHRALRRRVRHLQHLLDHRRAADARVRDAADDRRVAPAGARAR